MSIACFEGQGYKEAKFKSRWIKELNIKFNSLKMIEDKLGIALKCWHKRHLFKQNTNSTGTSNNNQ